jgi:hypothetical protein
LLITLELGTNSDPDNVEQHGQNRRVDFAFSLKLLRSRFPGVDTYLDTVGQFYSIFNLKFGRSMANSIVSGRG